MGPGSGFGRFALFLLSLLAVHSASAFSSKKTFSICTSLVVIQALLGISVRFWANSKYLPVLLNQTTKSEFLCQNLKFHYGDFYDCDGFFAQTIKPTDKVLIYNIHNLFYVNFPFDHYSWQDKTTHYTHILVGGNADLPKKFGQLPLIYQNPLTQVKLYLND